MSASEAGSPGRTAAVGTALAVIVAAAFSPLYSAEFLTFDDDVYVTANATVREGLTPRGVLWAFQSIGYASNWHPLTWLSHMADVTFFGLSPRPHHLVNVALHWLAATLLFAALHRMTGAMWRSALVAALFAVHPLHVESVAWVAERKDLLAAVFWALTMLLYDRYARAPAAGRYAAVLAAFTLGLLSKPMVITLPLVLLLLDLWPLGRLRSRPRAPTLGRMVMEKVPLALLSLLAGYLTLLAQAKGGALATEVARRPGVRAVNAVWSYLRYIVKTVWPTDLTVYYPYPSLVPPHWKTGLLLVALSAVTILVLARRRSPHLATGWLWYLVTLLPVIGLIQVGGQAMADRYTYLPLVGLFLALVWSIPRALPKAVGTITAAVAVGALTALALLSHNQSSHWRSDLSLYTHAFEVSPNNWMAEAKLGELLLVKGDLDAAIPRFTHVVSIKPGDAKTWYNLGLAQAGKGRQRQAADAYRWALAAEPGYYEAANRLGAALYALGDFDEALYRFRQAVGMRPRDADAHVNLGLVLEATGRREEAGKEYREALRLAPGHPLAGARVRTLPIPSAP